MTKETMTVHQALVELKTLDDRIIKAVSAANNFVAAKKHSSNQINGEPVSKFEAFVKDVYKSINDLIRRREAIKRGVVQSNAVTVVNIDGKDYTVAEAIAMNNEGMEYYRSLLARLVDSKRVAVVEAESKNRDIELRAEAHIASMYSSGEKKAMTAEMRDERARFVENQTYELVDPLDVDMIIANLEEKLRKFVVNFDSALSVSNAVTNITIEY